ncbi:unnamed protein product [Cyclocybe aegerita]|uniref:DUF1793-domain-containing protein n=1 Tax=Cyclocybe aegerita TaxID=1973307 RepID=A0A8S0XMS3_CYCAE|nr:unnamed protein product [Cyclocybe aegerita]
MHWVILLLFLGSTLEAWSQTTIHVPGAIPLAIRSPYFNSWLSTQDGVSLASRWPTFWNGQTLGWAGFVRVDGQSFRWLGESDITSVQAATTTAYHLTPTRSIFTMAAGPIRFNVTFMDPVDLTDWNRQSFPFSYLFIDSVLSADGEARSVQFYSYIDGPVWVSSTSESAVRWDTTETSSSTHHSISRSNPQPMVEQQDRAEDGTAYYALAKVGSRNSWQTGFVDSITQTFLQNGVLTNTMDTQFRPINSSTPALGLSADLGTISELDGPLVWALGFVREPAIRHVNNGAIESRSSYFWTRYKTVGDAIDSFLNDFSYSYSKIVALDDKIISQAQTISTQYADVVSLSLRQAVGSIDVTTLRDRNGRYVSSDMKVFMKDVGFISRTNPVNTMYAAFPVFLYLDPGFAGYMLEPLLEYQASSAYNNVFAAADLGISYPDALGNSTSNVLGAVENSAGMLIMVLAHALKTGDGTLADRYYDLLKTWADYLVKNTLHPSGYQTDDGLISGDMSNLALKGIIAIGAMAKIAEALEKPLAEIDNYKNQASSLGSQWQNLAITSGRMASRYGDDTNWALAYNLYAARLLESDVINEKIFSDQAAFYASQMSSAQKYGFAYDTLDSSIGKSSWLAFTAATTTDNSTRDALISMIHSRTFSNASSNPFSVIYDLGPGQTQGGSSSPAQGSMFSLLALSIPNRRIQLPLYRRVHKGVIAGSVVGGVLLISAVLAGAYFWRRRRRRRAEEKEKEAATPYASIQPREGVIQPKATAPMVPEVVVAGLPPIPGPSNEKSALRASQLSVQSDSEHSGLYARQQQEAGRTGKGVVLYGPSLEGSQVDLLGVPRVSASGSSGKGVVRRGGLSSLVVEDTPTIVPQSALPQNEAVSSPPANTTERDADLIREVRELRREMQQIRAQGQRRSNEPLPEYRDHA